MPFQKYTTIVIWDSASTNVLIELFSDYVVNVGVVTPPFSSSVASNSVIRSPQAKLNLNKATEDVFNASDAFNGRRDFAAMNNQWIRLCDTFKTRRDDANSTGSTPLQHWEFHDLMEQATSRMQ
ncbi:uncharacterized protein EV154DRAFT_584829 [Mucor mucedo]|uniref:uncharacterized protein n=1 Tax=Mucor mucedo TaxID=29922 RepID=UPI00221EE31C|nr:uncharacterized protein EV154DRAFT_584829 [Mucor mucedo]KAI7864872.1 hypothetical protein EV154DRAFT_584829 [Mucor mucedo]